MTVPANGPTSSPPHPQWSHSLRQTQHGPNLEGQSDICSHCRRRSCRTRKTWALHPLTQSWDLQQSVANDGEPLTGMPVLTHACSKQSATFGEEGFFQAIFRAVHYCIVALQNLNNLSRRGAEQLALECTCPWHMASSAACSRFAVSAAAV